MIFVIFFGVCLVVVVIVRLFMLCLISMILLWLSVYVLLMVCIICVVYLLSVVFVIGDGLVLNVFWLSGWVRYDVGKWVWMLCVGRLCVIDR